MRLLLKQKCKNQDVINSFFNFFLKEFFEHDKIEQTEELSERYLPVPCRQNII